MPGFGSLLLAPLLLLALASAQADTLLIAANTTDPAPRAAWQEAVRRFQHENPDIRVELTVYDHEDYKKAIRNWLTGAPPDVVFWFAGNRMRQFVVPGLLEEKRVLRVGARPAAFNESHAQFIELVRDAQLVVDRVGNTLGLAAVA